MDWAAVSLTARLALATTSILFILGVPIAYWIATTRWRYRFLIEAIVALPIVLPPTVIGFYVLMATGPNSSLGQTYTTLFGRSLPFTFPGILIGSLIYNLPFAVRPFASAFAAIDRRLVEASWCLGESKTRTFFRIILPASWPGILTGIVLTFAHTVGEFGVVLMLGGNISGETRTISIAIYDSVQALDYRSANMSAAALLAFAATVLSATYALQRRMVAL